MILFKHLGATRASEVTSKGINVIVIYSYHFHLTCNF